MIRSESETRSERIMSHVVHGVLDSRHFQDHRSFPTSIVMPDKYTGEFECLFRHRGMYTGTQSCKQTNIETFNSNAGQNILP